MRLQRLNNQKMKFINKQNVLRAIRKHKSIARKNLVEKTKLTTGTITNLTEELIHAELILEKGTGESVGGRKPTLLELNPNAGYAVGLEINTWQIICILSDFQGTQLARLRKMLNPDQSKEGMIDEMVEHVEKILRENAIAKDKVLGIGLAVPGPLNEEEGIMINPPNFPEWRNVPIRDIMQQRTGIKTYVEKETQSAVLGEYWFGETGDARRIFQLNAYELGIGGGFIADGMLLHGQKYGSMEIGHTVVRAAGRRCRCGSRGCLEAYANGRAIIDHTKELLAAGEASSLSNEQEITFSEVKLRAEEGDPVCVKSIENCARYMAIGVMNVIGLLSPEMVIFGGEFFDKSDLLFNKTVELLQGHPYYTYAGKVKKVRSSFGIDAGAVGGIASVLNGFSEL